MNSEYCEECGGVMVWRCTNNITHKSKWKCRDCGHILVNDYVPIEFKQIKKPEPKHYTYNNGVYQVKKRLNGHQHYLGSFKTEDRAKKFVALMKASDWELDRVSEFKEVCRV